MKCYELKSYNVVATADVNPEVVDSLGCTEWTGYDKNEVDAAIAELKAKLYEAEEARIDAGADAADYYQENRKLKRALWLARAERAHVTTLYWNVYCYQNNCLYFRDFMPENCNPFRSLPKKTAMEWSYLWESIETKCRSKAEECK